MKLIMTLIVALSFSLAHAKDKKSLCQAAAENAAAEEMDKMNTDGLTDDDGEPRALTSAEIANVSNVTFLKENSEEESDTETGIYGVEMIVMEECLDGLQVKTKLVQKKNKTKCEVIEIKSWGTRDCG